MSQVHATIFAGVEIHKGGNWTEKESQQIVSEIQQSICVVAGGCTLTHTVGSWLHEGQMMHEKAIRVDVLCKSIKQAKEIAQFIKQKLNQYSVLFEMQQVKGEFL